MGKTKRFYEGLRGLSLLSESQETGTTWYFRRSMLFPASMVTRFHRLEHEEYWWPNTQYSQPIARYYPSRYDCFPGNKVRIQISAHMVSTACALELHRRAKGEYPNSLQELVPDFIDSVPSKFFESKPLDYERAAIGRFKLWVDQVPYRVDQVPWWTRDQDHPSYYTMTWDAMEPPSR